MLVEAFSNQLVSNMNPMNQAIGSMIAQQSRLGEVNLIKTATDVGIDIDKARRSDDNSEELNAFLTKQMQRLSSL
jgi:hypothetical protein